jgi:hypothetical protein
VKIQSNQGKTELSCIVYGDVVMYKGFHCIVVDGPFDHNARKLPIVRLTDGKLLEVLKDEKMYVYDNATLNVSGESVT